MDFDFNLILVPVTLFFGLIWLLDKLWFSRNKKSSIKGIGASEKQVQHAQTNLLRKKQVYLDVLAQHGIDVDEVTITNVDSNNSKIESTAQSIDSLSIDDAPIAVKQAEREYREAKRQVNLAMPPKSSRHDNIDTRKPTLVRWAHDYFPVLAVVLIVRSFIIEPFNIPSPSMVPTLYTGDFIAVNKYAYGVRLPLTYNKVIDTGSPERGDVAVFRYPENPKIHFIKRVVGLPGDVISYDNGKLAVNGEEIPSKEVSFTADDMLTQRLYRPVKSNQPDREWDLSPEHAVMLGEKEEDSAHYFQEQLGTHTYLRRYLNLDGYKPYARFLNLPIPHDSQWQVTVPEGNYFVMGDNSDRSEDSRFWGFVPDENLTGKAFYVWMHKPSGLISLPTFKYNRSID